MAKTLNDLLHDARARVHEISVEELDELIEDHEQPLIVDVREPDEHARAHIPGTLLVPRGTLELAADPASAHRVEELSGARQRAVLVYCSDGVRSALAADTLQRLGFERVYSLRGGIEKWRAAGQAVIAD
jgi:rhodanese-related sulfurtransferase